MAIHLSAFKEELYTEHLEESEYLYETRCLWIEDPEVAWLEIDDLDARLEAHLDALVLGGAAALKLCLAIIEEADAALLHVVVRVFCRHGLADRLARLWKVFDFDDVEKVRAVSDAFRWECPAAWQRSFEGIFEANRLPLMPLVAGAMPNFGDRASQLMINSFGRGLEVDKAVLTASFLGGKALGEDQRLGLNERLDPTQPVFATMSLCALTMLGGAPEIKRRSNLRALLPIAFALAGDEEDARALISQAKAGSADDNCLLALGMSGHVEAVSTLVKYLKNEDRAPAAALALNLISGADLQEENFIPDQVEKDELFDFELEAFEEGQLPRNVEGVPFGREAVQLSLTSSRWKAWFRARGQQFSGAKRYRFGKPFTLTSLLDTVLSQNSPRRVRQYAHWEMMVRYGLRLPFAADDLIFRQKQQLNAIHAWVQEHRGFFTEQGWVQPGPNHIR